MYAMDRRWQTWSCSQRLRVRYLARSRASRQNDVAVYDALKNDSCVVAADVVVSCGRFGRGLFFARDGCCTTVKIPVSNTLLVVDGPKLPNQNVGVLQRLAPFEFML
jgi:hypothetical protein